MKLNDYFQTQKNTTLTDVDKLELYQKFLYKKDLKSPIRRFSFVHAKAFVYTLVTGFLLMGVYGAYLFNGSLNSPRFVINPNSNTVQADYIAQVVDFNGSFSIEHEGMILKTEKNISNGDTIILKDWAAMVFEIDKGIQSKILGPAKLTLQKINDPDKTSKYRVNFIYGNFIQMEGNKTPQNVELAVEDILIKQSDKSQPINFQLINNKGNRILKNNGANLIITKNGDKQTTKLNNKQILAIQDNDITLFKNRSQFTSAMQKGDVSQTFALNSAKYTDIQTTISDTNTGIQDEETPVSLMTLLAIDETPVSTVEDNTDKISDDISSLLGAGKQILTPEQNNKLRGTLWATFLMDDMQIAYTSSSTSKITSIISQLNASFGIKTTSTNTSDGIATLITTLSTKYEVPPKYIANLRTLQNRIPVIMGEKAQTREQLSTSLPGNLKFQ